MIDNEPLTSAIFSDMVFLFGNKHYGEHLGYIVTRCPDCRDDRIFSVDQRREKLTVYFVPTVQYRAKQYMTCQGCGKSLEIADKLKEEIAGRLMTETELKKVLGEIAGEHRSLMAVCQACSQPVERGMRFCPSCGHPLS
ncbi:zinc-ribbon domain-containing protein [Dehalogenimonas sp. THU2]|uniref:zinc-ribbon domain-containing protein n=1 Tax=Dehalogenimonas sp. THU2 TaxID=3151121 RepID=UPI0032188184